MKMKDVPCTQRLEVLEHQALINPSELRVGHFVASMDIPWSDTHFPLQGVLVEKDQTRRWFEAHCQWLVIDLLRSEKDAQDFQAQNAPLRSRSTVTARPQIAEHSAPEHPVNVLRRSQVNSKTMKVALSAYVSLDRQARRLISAFSSRSNLDIKAVEDALKSLSETLEENLSAMVWLTRIKQQDNYTAEHCINVAVLSMGLAHALEWDKDRIRIAGVSGLLHDLGKMNLDLSVLNKPERLTAEEFEHIKTHTTVGYDLVREDKDVHPDVARAVLEHHERPDGLGYPDGRALDEISPLSMLVGVVDAYDAITSHRVYDAARSHHEALGILWQQRGSQFDQQMVETFIQFMGWVTPGTLVRLSNGKLAVVMQTRVGQRLTPVVRALAPVGEGYRAGELIDLAHYPAGEEGLRIARVLPDGAEGVDMKKLLRGLVI